MRDGVNRLHYYLNDHLGSARVVIDSVGTIKDKYHYLAFGSSFDQTTSTGQPNWYTGKPYDQDAGMNLYYYGRRYYDSDGGRFTQVDPLRNKYPEWGAYVYCAENPLAVIDPDGNSWIECREYYLPKPVLIDPNRRSPYQTNLSVTKRTTYRVHWNRGSMEFSKFVPLVGTALSTYEYLTDADATAFDGLKLLSGPLSKVAKVALKTGSAITNALTSIATTNSWIEKSESLLGIDDPRVIALFESRYGDVEWSNRTSLEMAIQKVEDEIRRRDEEEKEKLKKEELQKRGNR